MNRRDVTPDSWAWGFGPLVARLDGFSTTHQAARRCLIILKRRFEPHEGSAIDPGKYPEMALVGKELGCLFGTYIVLFCQSWVDSSTIELDRMKTSAFFGIAKCRRGSLHWSGYLHTS